MRRLLILGSILGGMAGFSGALAQDESCGPKSGLCWPRIERGASGPRVVALQFLLRSKGYKVAPDGRFGFSTESAIRRFQAKNRLQVDGKLGWQSFEALTPNLRRDARGDAVRGLQTLLIQTGKSLPRDGVFGISTEKAVININLPIDVVGFRGKVTDTEWCYLVGGYWKGENRRAPRGC